MWLISTVDLSLVFHYECPEMQYAILSHTWEEDEVSFQDFKDLASARLKKGFSKIYWTVYLARQRGLKWAWVDTCCIDKSSSAELSEAINSMYRWYQKSAICYAFLSDLPSNGEQRLEDFQKCRWWTRGWTLQELIAPGEVNFYDQNWGYYGKRTDLQEKIKSFTGISLIAYQGRLNDLSVAQRMSWVSRRTTARTEDMAYCLLGLFDVNMPMIYGEGDKAFIRLQEEICKNSSDPTIFAWTIQPSLRTYKESQKHYGLLASHPAEFAGCANIFHNFTTQWSDVNYNISIGGSREIIFDRLSLRIDEDYGLLVHIGLAESTEFGTFRIFVPVKKTIGHHVRSFPDRLIGIPEEGQPIPPGPEIDEPFLKISVIKDYEFSHARLLYISRSAVSCPKRLTYDDSVRIDELHEQALLIKVDPNMQISAAYPENFWIPDKRAFLGT
ncbi:hypothetical protein PFICI_02992 [Pestalotiopsis fici W106-1]|uniref:Heterokaryon incompatibility domain-containing protein n=1 Tax=Pestalotiopsis fici (strain W106-1 / CGMCC3.15140) TaxID=1229662 RepID=W3XHP8_PESFW|nr:uncharacterized protein PFICI_02992 [Pestalotiopsis fici W106-1]ETS84967.1 hypothetical protein PFICI_02992 [Pestalotiopsis fici W106-1]